MRVSRSLLLLSALALSAAGCASQQVAYVPMAPASAVAPNSLDVMAYGSPVAAPRGVVYSTGYAQSQAYAAAYPQARGVTYPQAYNTTSPQAYSTTTSAQTYAAGCQQTYVAGCPQQAHGVTYAYPGYGQATESGPYTLDSGDRLRIVVFGQDGLTNSYAVDASGHVAMPLIGSIMARGLTTDQLSSRIADKLKDGYIREPHVAVEVEAYRPFFILGEVTQPGQYPYVANMTAETAVAIAGGFSARAVRQSVILTRTYNGQQMRMSVPLTYPLRPGDTVSVQERWF